MTQLPVHGCQILTLPVHSDRRGSLVSLEASTGVTFGIERTFYVFDTPEGAVRGGHAHRTIDELLVCIAGMCAVTVDDGRERTEILLDTPAKALTISPMVWIEMRNFTAGAVLLVLASGPYDESEYVTDYERFRALVKA